MNSDSRQIPEGTPPQEGMPPEHKHDAMNTKVMTRVIEYMKPYKGKYILMILTIIGAAILGLLPSMLSKRIVDDALVGHDTQMLVQLVLLSLILILLNQAVGLLSQYLNVWTSRQIVKDMKSNMFTRLVEMDHAFYTTHKQGEIITRMNSDVEGTSRTISGMVQQLLTNFATLITTVIAMLSMNWRVALIGLAILPLMILPSRLIGNLQKRLVAENQKMNDSLNQIVTDVLSENGSNAVKQFNREEVVKGQFNSLVEQSTKLSIREEAAGMTLMTTFKLISTIAPLAIYLVGGLMLVNVPEMNLTVGTITAMVALLGRLFFPLDGILMFMVSLNRSAVMFERVFDYLDLPTTVVNTETPVKPDIDGEKIAFDHVDFGYIDGIKALDDVSFEIAPGEVVAIVGSDGAGKSSVARLLPRLYDIWNGTISAGGEDLRKIDLHYLRNSIATATQTGHATNGTVRDNLIFANENATQEEMEQVCKVTGLHELVMSQPDGYDTRIDREHLVLSAGELEQLAIARALLKNPALLILDEATEEMNAVDESRVQDNVIEFMAGRKLLIITQREEVAKKADRILVMDQGKIVESGTYEQLGKDGTQFRTLFTS